MRFGNKKSLENQKLVSTEGHTLDSMLAHAKESHAFLSAPSEGEPGDWRPYRGLVAFIREKHTTCEKCAELMREWGA